MNSRGQAALEYLMTYGWALVIIVVVAGILFFIMSSPAGGVSCTSSDPTKMVLSSYNVPKTGTPTIKIQNATGGTINYSYTCNKTGTITGASFTCTASSGTASAGGYITVSPTYSGTAGSTLDTNTNVFIGYTDYFGYNKVATISCQGTPAAP